MASSTIVRYAENRACNETRDFDATANFSVGELASQRLGPWWIFRRTVNASGLSSELNFCRSRDAENSVLIENNLTTRCNRRARPLQEQGPRPLLSLFRYAAYEKSQ